MNDVICNEYTDFLDANDEGKEDLFVEMVERNNAQAARIAALEAALEEMSVEFNWMLLNGEYNDQRNTIANKVVALLKGGQP